MFARFLMASFALLLTGALTEAVGRTPRQVMCDHAHIDETRTAEVLLYARPDYWGKSCPDERCRAIHDIFCAMDGFAHRLVPNTMGYRSPEEARRYFDMYGRNIQALGLEHPKRIPLYCSLLAEVAATITGEPTPPDAYRSEDGYTVDAVVQLALRLDRPHHPCLAEVLAAVPQTPEAQQAVAWAKTCLPRIRWCQRNKMGMDF